MTFSSVFDDLKSRNMVHDVIDGLPEILREKPVTLYNGFDPTADSLHIGHLVPMIALARWQRYGHHVIALAGGGTGMIGDPSGKSDERNLLTAEETRHNVEMIKKQLSQFLDFEVKTNPARILNNGDWLNQLNLIDFLREIGKHFTVNAMLAKDSVRTRIDRESGISFTEFSYSLLQSYDFYHLFKEHGCTVQAGGSDQWGNITAGVELIRRKLGQTAYGIVYPLIKKKDGTKFGKTAGGAVWLDPKRTSPYKFYQFWLNADDGDVMNFIRFYTFFDSTRIAELEEQVTNRPEERAAQKALADEMTRMMHGETALSNARQASAALFGGDIDGLSADDIRDIFSDVPSKSIHEADLVGAPVDLASFLSETTGFMKSKGEVRRAIAEGGVYLNNRRAADAAAVVTKSDFMHGEYLVVRRGKKNYFLVHLV